MRSSYQLQQKKLVKELEDSFASGSRKTTVVKIQKDYANNDQICLTSVIFIPEEISRKILSDITEKLEKIESQHYFYPPESMHLTIKNIRTINKPPLFTESDIEKVNQLFRDIIPQFPDFDFNIEDVLIFPTSISLMAYSNDTFQKLVTALDKGLRQIGVPDNKRYLSDSVFWGNITLCRFTQNPSSRFIEEVKKMRDYKTGSFRAGTIDLITCNGVCHPKSRKIINEYKLKKEFAA